MPKASRLILLCAVALLAACEPDVPAMTNAKVMIIQAGTNGTYDTKQVELTTPTSVVHLTGPLLTMVGGGFVEINEDELAVASSDEQRAEILLKNKGNSVRANFIDKGGVLWPSDFHTWAMVSAYYNFEQAFLYYQRAYNGKPTTELKDFKVLYWGGFKISGGEDERDNAIYYSGFKGFLLAPGGSQQKVPIPMNLGIIGHEFAHLAFHKKVFSGVAFPKPLGSWSLAPFNLLKSLDEGLADFHGYGVTCASAGKGAGCKSNLLIDSFNDVEAVQQRNIVDPNRCMTMSLRASFNNFSQSQWVSGNQLYQLGNLFAVSLYLASTPDGKEEALQKSLIEAYDDSTNNQGLKQFITDNLNTQSNFNMENVINIFANHISDMDLRRKVCTQLRQRLQPETCPGFPCDPIPACASAPSGTACPQL